MIDNTRLTPTSTEADTGIWTRVNRNKPSEKSVIDYIVTTPTIHKNRKMNIIDESGEFRVKGKKETDHNTMTLTININQPRTPQFRESWKLNNSEGWKKFNEEIKAQAERNPEMMNDYNKLENAIISTLETTIGKTKTRTDKPRKPTDENKKKAKLRKKAAKMAFQIACNEGQDTTKASKLKRIPGGPEDLSIGSRSMWKGKNRTKDRKPSKESKDIPQWNMAGKEEITI